VLHVNFNFYKQYCSTSYNVLMFFWSDSRFVLELTGSTQLKTAAGW
jgi:hypothetical protein